MKAFDPLIQKFITSFHERGESVVKTIINCTIPTKIVLMKYNRLEAHEKLENINEDQKREIWEYSKELLPSGTTEQRIDACKVALIIANYIPDET